jgi:hypothetical protein
LGVPKGGKVARCAAIKTNGERCKNRAATGSEWCSSHDPARAEARREAARKAGRARHAPKASREVEVVKNRLGDLTDDVLAGRVLRARAAVAGQLLNTWLRAAEIQRRWLEADELTARVEQLEAMLTERERLERQAGSWAK